MLATINATAKTNVAFNRQQKRKASAVSEKFSVTSALLPAFGDHAGEAIEFFGRNACDFTAEQGGDYAFRGTVEESLHQMTKGGAASDAARYGWEEKLAKGEIFVHSV